MLPRCFKRVIRVPWLISRIFRPIGCSNRTYKKSRKSQTEVSATKVIPKKKKCTQNDVNIIPLCLKDHWDEYCISLTVSYHSTTF